MPIPTLLEKAARLTAAGMPRRAVNVLRDVIASPAADEADRERANRMITRLNGTDTDAQQAAAQRRREHERKAQQEAQRAQQTQPKGKPGAALKTAMERHRTRRAAA